MKIICVGAGASGLFFACLSAAKGHEVLLIESNEKVGRKLFITGKGRCNLTNQCAVRECVDNVVSNPKFLFSALSAWTSEDTMNFFSSRGCPLKVERGNRVFPQSDKASDIVDCLYDECRKRHVAIRFGEAVRSVSKKGETFVVETQSHRYEGDALVIATGGKSYPQTGSTGDGYRFAEAFGHTVVPPVSALCPLRIQEPISMAMTKLTLKNVTLTATSGKFHKSVFGDLEFLPRAITGPIALTMSSYINRLSDVRLTLDFKPALSEETLDARLVREIQKNPNGDLRALLSTLLPLDIIPFFLNGKKFDEKKPLNSIKKEERREILMVLKSFPLTYLGLDAIEKGIVTSGGIAVNEINAKTMESKKVPGLYFIGEVLDVDALTGGFNLQLSFATAHAAAEAI
ncbi:MAG: NAD(P)/FAD-dependent oxidoreductase [Bacilli bacterium]|nr:NAD(P)/FAD-dependent oxidoreductase [Bacilli bacterium]